MSDQLNVPSVLYVFVADSSNPNQRLSCRIDFNSDYFREEKLKMEFAVDENFLAGESSR